MTYQKSPEEKAAARSKMAREFAHNTRHMKTYQIFIGFVIGPGAAYLAWLNWGHMIFPDELFPKLTFFFDVFLTCFVFPILAINLTFMGLAMCFVRLCGGSPYQPPGQKPVSPSTLDQKPKLKLEDK